MPNTADIALPPKPERDNDDLRIAVWDAMCYWKDSPAGVDALTASNAAEDMIDMLLEAYARSAVAADREAGRAGDAGGVSGSEYFKIGLLEWGVAGWRSEVANRPLVNIHRERLDAFWRNVIIKAGVDPDSIIGPSHAELLAAAAPQPPRVDKSA